MELFLARLLDSVHDGDCARSVEPMHNGDERRPIRDHVSSSLGGRMEVSKRALFLLLP